MRMKLRQDLIFAALATVLVVGVLYGDHIRQIFEGSSKIECPMSRPAATSNERVGCLIKAQREQILDLTERLEAIEELQEVNAEPEEDSAPVCAEPPPSSSEDDEGTVDEEEFMFCADPPIILKLRNGLEKNEVLWL